MGLTTIVKCDRCGREWKQREEDFTTITAEFERDHNVIVGVDERKRAYAILCEPCGTAVWEKVFAAIVEKPEVAA